MTKVARNVLIIAAIAAIIDFAPGGGTGSRVVLQGIGLLFLGTIAWFASIAYRQHRTALYSLGDARRGGLYAALAVATLTLSATPRLFQAGGVGVLVWLVLIGAAAYTVIAILWAARSY